MNSNLNFLIHQLEEMFTISGMGLRDIDGNKLSLSQVEESDKEWRTKYYILRNMIDIELYTRDIRVGENPNSKILVGDVFYDNEEVDEYPIFGKKDLWGYDEELPMLLKKYVGKRIKITVEEIPGQ